MTKPHINDDSSVEGEAERSSTSEEPVVVDRSDERGLEERLLDAKDDFVDNLDRMRGSIGLPKSP
jgi:hypothetical protein